MNFPMAEEFEESEVMFQLEVVDPEMPNEDGKVKRKTMKKKTRRNNASLSVPVNIPEGKRWYKYVEADDYFGGGEMVPPHVIMNHRVAGKMIPFSVCTGNGRTLKGRDLSQVRNEILRMTGFLET